VFGEKLMIDPQKSTQQTDVLQEQIFNSLEKAQAQKNKLKRNSSRYTIANIVLGAIAALLAGTAGTIGRAETWKPICLLAAACSIGATVTAKLQTADQLTEASECVGQLKSLRIETIAPTYDAEHIREKYQQILLEFSEIDC
jgi:uncharacterized membrane protein YebE (DUF533 family)